MGSEVEIEVDGDDEEMALVALVAMVNDKFGEGQ
jgi:phosphocarrier protein